jgi:hypothetical protein
MSLRRLGLSAEELRQRWKELAERGSWFDVGTSEEDCIDQVVRLFGGPPYEFLRPGDPGVLERSLGARRSQLVDPAYRAKRPGPAHRVRRPYPFVDNLGRMYAPLERVAIPENLASPPDRGDERDMWYKRPRRCAKVVDHPYCGEIVELRPVRRGQQFSDDEPVRRLTVVSTNILPRTATGIVRLWPWPPRERTDAARAGFAAR